MSWKQPVFTTAPLAKCRKLACLGVVALWIGVAMGFVL
jgi:hypothetical protein